MKPSHPIGRSTSYGDHRTRHLNAFRGVRAISKFDWPFTPTLGSSRSFSTLIGSVLHSVLPELQPGQVLITWFRVYPHRLDALFRLAFTAARDLKSLTLPVMVTRRFIMQKARRHRLILLRPLVGAWFQDLFHSPHRSAFHLSFTVLVRYRSHGSI